MMKNKKWYILGALVVLLMGYPLYQYLSAKKSFDKSTTIFVASRFITELTTPPEFAVHDCPFKISLPLGYKLHMKTDFNCAYQDEQRKVDVILGEETETWQELWSRTQNALSQHSPESLAKFNKLSDSFARLQWIQQYLTTVSTNEIATSNTLTAVKLALPFMLDRGDMYWQRISQHVVITAKQPAPQPRYLIFFPDGRVLKMTEGEGFNQDIRDQLIHSLTH